MGSTNKNFAANIITINRGDTYAFDLTIYDDSTDGRYILQDDDVLYFGLMDPRQKFEDALLRKRYTKDDCDEGGNLNIEIRPEDTLDLLPGVYYYAVKLHRMKNTESEFIDKVITVINKTKFVIND